MMPSQIERGVDVLIDERGCIHSTRASSPMRRATAGLWRLREAYGCRRPASCTSSIPISGRSAPTTWTITPQAT